MYADKIVDFAFDFPWLSYLDGFNIFVGSPNACRLLIASSVYELSAYHGEVHRRRLRIA